MLPLVSTLNLPTSTHTWRGEILMETGVVGSVAKGDFDRDIDVRGNSNGDPDIRGALMGTLT